MEILKRFLAAIAGSKKAVAAVAAVIFVLLAPQLSKLGLEVSKDELETVVQLAICYILGQGLADVGKSKALIEKNAAASAAAPATVEPEKA